MTSLWLIAMGLVYAAAGYPHWRLWCLEGDRESLAISMVALGLAVLFIVRGIFR